MDYYLGLDGGGTRTRFLLCDETGAAASLYITETIHLHQAGKNGMYSIMHKALKELCNRAKIEPSQIRKAFLGFAGYGEVQEEQCFIDKLVMEMLPSAVCGNDVQAAWAGAHAVRAGVQIVAGTGSIAYARNEAGDEARCGGWGHFFGDEGSGYWIAQKALTLFSQQSDGRHPRGPLYNLIRAKFSLANDFDLIGIYQTEFLNKRAKIAALAPLVFEAASAGDADAKSLICESAQELGHIAHVAASSLSWVNDEITVSYCGGVWKAGNILIQALEASLNSFNLNYKLQRPVLSPVAGAVYYAFYLSNYDEDERRRYLKKLISIDEPF